VIYDYLESLAGALSFDRSLSRCVQQEVEDHLWEAVATDPIGDRLEAERRAIANFGDPHIIRSPVRSHLACEADKESWRCCCSGSRRCFHCHEGARRVVCRDAVDHE
jgi:hypothetical protein